MEKQTEKQLPFPVYNDNWQWFKLIDLFDIQGTKKQLPTDETKSGPYPHVSSKATNNGVMEHYDYFTEKGGVLTIESSCNGYCSYQKQNFSTHGHIIKLIPKFKMDDFIALFLVTVINLDREYYNYGRKCSMDKLRKRLIKLPVQKKIDSDRIYSAEGYIPDWEYMHCIMLVLSKQQISCRNGLTARFFWPKEEK